VWENAYSATGLHVYIIYRNNLLTDIHLYMDIYVFYIDVRTHTQFAEKVELSEDCAAEF